MKRKEKREKRKEKKEDIRVKRCVKVLFIFYLLHLTSYLLLSCTSLIQRGGEFLEGKSDRTIAVYQSDRVEVKEIESREGIKSLEIASSRWPGFSLLGSMSDSSGTVHLNEVRFFSSHVQGWNEFNLDILGSAVFLVTNAGETMFYIEGELERVQINSGRILLRGNMLSGTSALVPLRNRRERILALNEWMSDSFYNRVFTDMDEFENFFKPHLFPELVAQKSRPLKYSAENAEWARSDSIRWNLTYSKDLFPEHLWEYRNSGAMLRDWEEALPWIFMEYSWDIIVNSFR